MTDRERIEEVAEEWKKAMLYELQCKQDAAHAALGLRQAHKMVLNAEDKKRSIMEEIMKGQVHSWTPLAI